MKRVAIASGVVAVVCTWVCTGVFAQAFSGQAVLDRVGQVSLSLSWTAHSQINVPVSGWLRQIRGEDIRDTGVDAAFRVQTRGLWIELALPLRVADNVEIAAYGRYLVPVVRNVADMEGTGNQIIGADGPFTSSLSLSANVKPTWYGVELEATFRRPIINVLTGLRYDNITARLTGGQDEVFSRFEISRAWIETNSLVPYVGVGTRIGGVDVHLKGFPALVIGTANIKKGYYGELMARWMGPSSLGGLRFSLFGKMIALTAIFDEVPVAIFRFENGIGAPQPSPSWSELGREGSIVVSWRAVELGASFHYEFSSSL